MEKFREVEGGWNISEYDCSWYVREKKKGVVVF